MRSVATFSCILIGRMKVVAFLTYWMLVVIKCKKLRELRLEVR